MVPVALVLVVLGGCTESGDPPGPSPSSTASPSASTTAPTTTAAPTSAPVDPAGVVFPTVDSGVRYTTPDQAAAAFATEYVGVTTPVLGVFQAGDARSGEVEVRARAEAAPSTVLVRQLADGNWWVLGATMANIRLDQPTAGAKIASPVRLTGGALAYEGHVDVEIRADGAGKPIGSGFVTGGGDVMQPFDGSVPFTAPTVPYGAIVMVTRSGQDGSVADFVVVRVAF